MLSGFTAWVDESGSNPRTDPGTYILSAVICEDTQVEAARATMRELLLAKGGKLHWRDEDRARQEHIGKSIADLSVEHLIVVRSNASPTDRLERQRRLCLERMLPELAAFGIDTAVFESRGPKDDQRDLQTLDYLRRKQMLTGHLHIDHVGGRRFGRAVCHRSGIDRAGGDERGHRRPVFETSPRQDAHQGRFDDETVSAAAKFDHDSHLRR